MHKNEVESLLSFHKLFIFLPIYRQGTDKVQGKKRRNSQIEIHESYEKEQKFEKNISFLWSNLMNLYYL